jgi:predicted dehydrogenase
MKQESNQKSSLSRRKFLKRGGVAASSVFAVPWIVPASALGRGGAVAPSERLVMAGIGINGRGTGVLRWMMGEPDVQFVAICDVRKDRREAVKQMIDTKYGSKDCTMHRDIREFLAERNDIDGVLIATGDHWHALASILAMRAGKDVYCEKPSSMTIAEGQAVVETAKRYGRIYQTGTQRLSESNHVFAMEAARTGLLGKVHTAMHTSHRGMPRS